MDTEMVDAPEFTAPEPVSTDADAPYGRRADGSPKAKPGRPKGSRTGQPGTGTKAPTPPRPRSTSSRPKAAAKPDYRAGITGLFQLAAAPLAVAGQRNTAFLADSATLVAYAEPMANGLQEVANNDPRVAAVLDKVLRVGPYAAVVAPLIGMVTQVAVNHGAIPIEVGTSLGAMAPNDLIARVTGREVPEPAPAA